ncbi:odorant receptor 13a-like [Lasioglossum baleicum]|uniref:odorant receptor 13a-like n=1 Tax=Lasioglossum baleicum TaxID=434251 RepID=UPI003FCEBBAB
MGYRVTPRMAISFTKASVALTRAWPPPLQTSKSELFFFNVSWCASFISSIGLLLPLFNAICKYYDEPIILGKNVSLFAAVAQVAIKMIVCRLMQKQFQRLFFDMEEFCEHATEKENAVLQRHVDRYKYVHGVYTLWCFLTTVFVICGPLYSPQAFPTHAKYPFPVEEQPLRSIIFFHQSLVGFQASAGMAIDAQVALLLRYATARFEILAMKLERVQSESQLNACILEHARLLSYTKNIYRAVRFICFATAVTTNLAVIFGSLNLVTKQPLPLKILYALVVVSASGELFMYAWPADSLIHQSTGIARSVYNSTWFEQNVKQQKKMYFMILRSQKREAIQITGFLPQISLFYYAKFLYTAFSYFTALRVMVEKTNVDRDIE